MQTTGETEIVRQLATFAVGTKYRDIPTEVVEFVKGMILKAVAGNLVGFTKPSGWKMAAVIKSRGLPEEVGAIGCGFKTSLWDAVFLNAFLAHCAEMTDDFTVSPLALSLAEKRGLSGKAVVEAVVVGLEVHTRVCMFQNAEKGFSFIPGGVGPAAAAAKLLGLDVPQTMAAVSLATPTVGITTLNMGTDAHYYESALMSLQAVIAGEMAREGMTGNPDIISFLCNILGKENVAREEMTKDLGKEWLVCRKWIKKYPCCFKMHRYLDALLELRTELGFTYDDVENVTADIGPEEEHCDRPGPQTETDLQFSFQNVLGAVLLDGEVNLRHVDEKVVYEPKLKEARGKVHTVMHPEWPRDGVGAQRSVPARVVVRMKNGTEFSKERFSTIGSWPEPPLNREEILRLYRRFSRDILSEELILETGHAISDLENLTNVNGLMDTLRL